MKPIKDAIVSFVLCSCLAQLSVISPGNSYVLWFVGVFTTISIIDDVASGHFLDKKEVERAFYHTINAGSRIFGMLVGVIFVWIFLIGVTGINIFNAVLSIIYPITFLFVGIILRMSMSIRIKVQETQ